MYAQRFGVYPTDYLIEKAERLCNDIGVESLEDLSTVLWDDQLRKELDIIIKSKFPGSEICRTTLFQAAIVALGEDREAAFNFVQETVQSQWERVERIARREVVGDLPESLDTFVTELKAGKTRVEQVASVLGGKSRCSRCVEDIVNPREFEVGILDHYECKDTDPPGEIQKFIMTSHYVPDVDHTDMCPGCGNSLRSTLED